jgi:hypothetical protein
LSRLTAGGRNLAVMQGTTRKTISFPLALAREIAQCAAKDHRNFSKQVVAICEDLFFAKSRLTACKAKGKK